MNNQQTTTGSRGSKNSGKFASAQEAVSDVRETAMNSARDVVSDVRERAGAYFDGFNASPTTFIRNNPMSAAIGGVIAGFILGAAVSRRSLK